MDKLYAKINKSLLFIICLVLAGVSALAGILMTIVTTNAASLINSFVFTGLLVFLAFAFKGENVEKVKIAILLLLGSFVFGSLGNCVTYFSNAGDFDGVLAAYYVFDALALLSLFVGVVCHLLPMLFDKMPAKIMGLIATIAYLVAIALSLLSGILFFFVELGGEKEALSKIAEFLYACKTCGTLFLLSCFVNQNKAE